MQDLVACGKIIDKLEQRRKAGKTDLQLKTVTDKLN